MQLGQRSSSHASPNALVTQKSVRVIKLPHHLSTSSSSTIKDSGQGLPFTGSANRLSKSLRHPALTGAIDFLGLEIFHAAIAASVSPVLSDRTRSMAFETARS